MGTGTDGTVRKEGRKEGRKEENIGLTQRLDELRDRYSEVVNLVRDHNNAAATGDEYVKRVITNADLAANCTESSIVSRYDLIDRGVNAELIGMEVYDKLPKASNEQPITDHMFVLIGAKSKADFHKPTTWGNKAVIVDSWAGLVKPAREALDYFNQIFKVNPEKHRVRFIGPLEPN